MHADYSHTDAQKSIFDAIMKTANEVENLNKTQKKTNDLLEKLIKAVQNPAARD